MKFFYKMPLILTLLATLSSPSYTTFAQSENKTKYTYQKTEVRKKSSWKFWTLLTSGVALLAYTIYSFTESRTDEMTPEKASDYWKKLKTRYHYFIDQTENDIKEYSQKTCRLRTPLYSKYHCEYPLHKIIDTYDQDLCALRIIMPHLDSQSQAEAQQLELKLVFSDVEIRYSKQYQKESDKLELFNLKQKLKSKRQEFQPTLLTACAKGFVAGAVSTIIDRTIG